MNRRSFVIGLFGGIAATGLGGAAIAREAAATSLDAATGELAPAVKAGLDQADADFSQVVVRERVVRRRRPVVTRRVVVRRRGPVVTRRVIVRRPRRVVRRRVIVR
ncbi:hypothetical protein ASG72_08940 [Bosea sp. Leaf344]|uniref:hypothetical protein n=1 Tax=Bosea sp. Leaf344 TaxID=1736346 RepID=UPI0006F70EF3|nr:hypothetical protein [Bosea sp. Leaf344]KQU51641.1 hypothetical protein ASG72_08940 [Bosea sp. Leaf344]